MTFRRENFRLEKPVAANYVTPSGVMCVQVMVPDDNEHVALLQGLMANLTNAENWQGTEAEKAQLSYLWEVAYVQTDWGQCVTPSEAGNQARVSLWHRWAQIAAGNALQVNVDATVLYGHYVRQNTAASGDETYQDCWLSAGTYAYRVLYYRLTVNGQLDLLLVYQPDSSITTIVTAAEMYGTALQNQVISGTFTISNSGQYKLHFKIATKNAASSGFGAPLTMTEIWKTSD